MPAKPLPPPLLSADSAVLAFYPGKDRKTDANYPNWAEKRMVLPGTSLRGAVASGKNRRAIWAMILKVEVEAYTQSPVWRYEYRGSPIGDEAKVKELAVRALQ